MRRASLTFASLHSPSLTFAHLRSPSQGIDGESTPRAPLSTADYKMEEGRMSFDAGLHDAGRMSELGMEPGRMSELGMEPGRMSELGMDVDGWEGEGWKVAAGDEFESA